MGSEGFIQVLRLAINQSDPTPGDLMELRSYILSSLDQSLHQSQLAVLEAAYPATAINFNPQLGSLQTQAGIPTNHQARRDFQRLFIQAFDNWPAKPTDPSWAATIQGPSEPFSLFADRVKQAVRAGLPHGQDPEPIVRSLLFANANKECRKAMENKGVQTGTVAEKMRACASVTYTQAVMVIEKTNKGGKNQLGNCYKCGKSGHWSPQCPDRRKPPSPCPLCQGDHWKRDCPRSKNSK